MNNNDIFKKLRVALMLRDDQIAEILELVDFRISKAELGAFFRNADHPNYMECGDQVLRNFLNGLVIHLRGTKEDPKNPMDVINKNKESKPAGGTFPKALNTKNAGTGTTGSAISAKKPFKKKTEKPARKTPIVEKVKFNNGKKKS
jgi:hypothetical protein